MRSYKSQEGGNARELRKVVLLQRTRSIIIGNLT